MADFTHILGIISLALTDNMTSEPTIEEYSDRINSLGPHDMTTTKQGAKYVFHGTFCVSYIK